MVLDTAQLLSMVIGLGLPLVNGLLTRYGASTARVYLGIVLSLGNGFLVEWLAAATAGDQAFNLTQAFTGFLVSLVTALAVEAKVWAPLGVSETVKRIGSADLPDRAG